MKTYPRQSNQAPLRQSYSGQAGFTLIELMIASAIFIVVTVTGVSVLINATNNYRTTSQVRQSMDTLSFVMEDMARTIRLGTMFHCSDLNGIGTFRSCAVNAGTNPGLLGGSILALEGYSGNPVDDYDQVIYWIAMPTNDPTKGVLYKKTQSSLGSQTGAQPDPGLFSQITPDNVHINPLQSGFSVSEPGSAAATPIVTIRLSGDVMYRSTVVPFDIQTSIAPRTIPNPAP